MSRLLIALLFVVLLPSLALAQQTVRDSVKVTWHIHTFNLPKSEGDTCGYLLYVTWPNVAKRVLNREFRYWEYRLAATGEDGWITRGMELRAWQWGIDLGEDTYAYDPQLFGFGPDQNCGDRIAGGQATFGGRPRRVNGRTWRVTPWYAVYSVPDGTPIAEFEWEQTSGLEVAFDGSFKSNLSREATVDGRKPVVSYEWDFGDGTVSTGSAPTHTYNAPGTYVVSLTVTDDDGETDTVTEEVVVTGVILSYEVTAPENVFIGDTLRVTVEITNTGVGPATTATVLKDVLMFPSYPPNLGADWTNNARHSGPLLDSGNETVSDLAPGESFSFEQKYKITRSAHSRINGVWKDHAVDWKLKAQNVSGEDESGNAALIRDACEENACDNVTTIGDPEPEMRYALTLERVPGEDAKVRAKDGGDTAALVGDTVLTKIRVENFGDVPLENIRLPQDEASIQIGTEANRTALAFAKSIRTTVARLEPGASGEIVFAHEIMHEVQGTLQIFVSAVEATAVNEKTGARETISEIVTSCSVSNKASIPESQGCASLRVVEPKLERRFTVRPDTVDLKTNVVVNVLVKNTGSVDVSDVVPGAEPVVAEVIYPNLPGGTTAPPKFELASKPDPASVTLAPEETEGFQFRYRVTRTAQWTTDDGTKQAIPATVVFKPGPGTQGRFEELIVGAESTCEPSPCTDSTVLRGAVYKVAITSASGPRAKTGLPTAFSAADVRFVRYEDTEAGRTPICESGCADFILRVRDEEGNPGKNLDVEVTATQTNTILLKGAPGGFVCERVPLHESGTCVDAGQPLTVRTDEEGQAQVWMALQAGELPSPSARDRPEVQVEAKVLVVSDETIDGELTVPLDQTVIMDGRVRVSDASKLFIGTTHAVSKGAEVVSIGGWCESFLDWRLEQGWNAADLTRHQKNVLQLQGWSQLVTFICGTSLKVAGASFPLVKVLEKIDGVADAVKKFTDLAQFTWFAQTYEIDNGSDLVSLLGPLPPPFVVWIKGDAVGLASEVAGNVLAPGSNSILIQEASGLEQPTGVTLESDFAPSQFDGLLRVQWTSSDRDVEKLLSLGYAPVRTSVVNLRSEGFLVNNRSGGSGSKQHAVPATLAGGNAQGLSKNIVLGGRYGTLVEVARSGAPSVRVEAWEGAPGEYVVMSEGTSTPEVLQVAAVQSAGSEVSLTFTTPLRYAHVAGALVERIAPGTLAPPAPPVLRPHLSEEAPDELAWASMPTALASSYDLQVVTDTTAKAGGFIVDKTGLTGTSLGVDPNLFATGTEYFWRVRARSTLDSGPWSSWQSFQPSVPFGIDIWPGDTNGDDTVDQADVLPLGLHWGTTGGSRSTVSCQWQAWPVAPWTSELVTYADANGDGAVDQADVLCIGLNWGQAVNSPSSALVAAKTTSGEGPAAALRVSIAHSSLRDGAPDETVWATVRAEGAPGLLGTAFGLTVPADQWTVERVEPGDWLGADALLQTRVDAATGTLGVGITRRRSAGPAPGSGGTVARVQLRRTSAASGGEIALREPSASFASGIVADLTAGTAAALEALPERFVVHGNAPNPFRERTTIRYELPTAQDVTVAVYDILGRRRATLVDERQPPGEHKVLFTATVLPSGTYFVRVTAGTEQDVYAMRLIR